MTSEHPQPVDLAVTTIDILRERVDLWNRRFFALSVDLDRIDSTVAVLIGENHNTNDHSENAD